MFSALLKADKSEHPKSEHSKANIQKANIQWEVSHETLRACCRSFAFRHRVGIRG
jgi:hypothetical protein